MQELDIQSVDKVLDEINEQADQMAQIQDAMSQPMGGAAALDEDDLLAELEVCNPCHKPLQGHVCAAWSCRLVEDIWNLPSVLCQNSSCVKYSMHKALKTGKPDKLHGKAVHIDQKDQ